MHWNKGGTGSAILQLLFLVLTRTHASAQADQLVYRKIYAMGTVFEIAAYNPSPSLASHAIDKAFQEVIRLDHIMSDYDADSDLSRVNRTAHFRAEPVPADLYEIIKESLAYSRLSMGKFDITVGPVARLWKAGIQNGKAPSIDTLRRFEQCVGWQKVILVPPDRVEFRSPCMAIDLGAIGKGYAVDRVAAVLRSFGINSALISAGASTIYAVGSPPDRAAWVVHLRDPSGKLGPEASLRNNSVSTSEQTRNPQPGSGPFGHIIDPAEGVPAATPYSVSVVADSATASDALSTTLLLLGPKRGKVLIKKLPNVAAAWISSEGNSEFVSNGPQISTNHLAGSAH